MLESLMSQKRQEGSTLIDAIFGDDQEMVE